MKTITIKISLNWQRLVLYLWYVCTLAKLLFNMEWGLFTKRLSDLLLQEGDSLTQWLLVENVVEVKEHGPKRMYIHHRKMCMPFHFLPSCSRIDIKLSAWDWLMTLFGFQIRKPATLLSHNWKNGEANRFVFHIFILLANFRKQKDMRRYWELAWTLMNSEAYQVMCYNYVVHNWHQHKPVPTVLRQMRDLKSLCKSKATEIDFVRVYIPKASGKLRPLGVPTIPWRVYLHMLNNLIVWSRTGDEGNQHAYFPARSVFTAWKQLTDLLEMPNIYEYDLEQFFDAVDLEKITVLLRKEYNYPKPVAAFFRKLNRSLVQLPPASVVDRMEEPDRRLRYTADLRVNPNFRALLSDKRFLDRLTKEHLPTDPLKLMRYYKHFGYLQEDDFLTDLIGPSQIERFENLPEYGNKFSLPKAFGPGDVVYDLSASEMTSDPDLIIVGSTVAGGGWKEKGVPQGAATSCSLSTVALTSLLHRPHPPVVAVGYADDGLLASPHDIPDPIGFLESRTCGVKVNQSKSQWLKRNGNWLVSSFTFLGFEYFPANRNLSVSKIQMSDRSIEFCWALVPLSLWIFDSFWLPVFFFLLMSFDVSLPHGERIRAKTRKGSELEFTLRARFLKWLLEARDDVIRIARGLSAPQLGGSASHLNSLKRKDWLRDTISKWYSYLTPTHLLFKGRWVGLFGSRMYLGTWNYSVPQDFRLEARNMSWAADYWVSYQSSNWQLMCEKSPYTQQLAQIAATQRLLRAFLSSAREVFSAGGPKEIPRPINRLLKNCWEASLRLERDVRGEIFKCQTQGLTVFNASSFACDWLLQRQHVGNRALVRNVYLTTAKQHKKSKVKNSAIASQGKLKRVKGQKLKANNVLGGLAKARLGKDSPKKRIHKSVSKRLPT